MKSLLTTDLKLAKLEYYSLCKKVNFSVIHSTRIVIHRLHEKCLPLRISAKSMKLRIWSYLLKKSLMENFIFCAVKFLKNTVKLLGFVNYR